VKSRPQPFQNPFVNSSRQQRSPVEPQSTPSKVQSQHMYDTSTVAPKGVTSNPDGPRAGAGVSGAPRRGIVVWNNDNSWASEDISDGAAETAGMRRMDKRPTTKEKIRPHEVTLKAPRRRELFVKQPKQSYSNLGRTQSGLLPQLLNPDPTVTSPARPSNLSSTQDMTRPSIPSALTSGKSSVAVSTDAASLLSVSPPDHSPNQNTPTEPPLSPIPVSPEPSAGIPPLALSRNRSIILESLKELPSWHHIEGEWAAASALQYRAKYPIHNPVGPHFYKNVHLSPPNRPNSVFSPSPPPMSTEPASAPIVPSSHSPSSSPIPTPSSKTRIVDPSGKVRTRKLSNTAHDNLDLLDGSDPYGTNWHHESPYDGLGLGNDRTAASPDGADVRASSHSIIAHINDLH
jgi:hypothetical protein